MYAIERHHVRGSHDVRNNAVDEHRTPVFFNFSRTLLVTYHLILIAPFSKPKPRFFLEDTLFLRE
jgi:hypothetical protein